MTDEANSNQFPVIPPTAEVRPLTRKVSRANPKTAMQSIRESTRVSAPIIVVISLLAVAFSSAGGFLYTNIMEKLAGVEAIVESIRKDVISNDKATATKIVRLEIQQEYSQQREAALEAKIQALTDLINKRR